MDLDNFEGEATAMRTAPTEHETQQVHFTVPLVPPSVNHYVQHFKGGVHVVSEEAKAFKLAVYIFGRDQPTFSGKNTTYSVFLAIYLAKGQKGDIDNFPKLILDGLRDAKIIHSDAAVMCLHIELFRDPANPRTEITVDARRAR